MSRLHIAGQLDYARLAQQHRPADDATLAANARALATQGLIERDISDALQVGIEDVRQWLQQSEARP